MQRSEIQELLERYVRDELSGGELDLLFEIIASGRYDNLIQQFLKERLGSPVADSVGIPADVSDGIIRNISEAAAFTDRSISTSYRNGFGRRYAIMARYLVAASFFISFVLYLIYSRPDSKERFITFIPRENHIHQRNTDDQTAIVRLSDGSVVRLEKDASIHYPKQFTGGQREVYLQGDAFFEVAKDSRKPFIVYSGSIVTRVLGTSFFIRDDPRNQIEVEVRSGKVQVFENTKLTGSKGTQHVLLQPNQKVIFNESDGSFLTGISEKPVRVKSNGNEFVESMEPVVFVYTKTNLKDILLDLERNYAIDIVLENENLNNCFFTGDITDQDLFSKLKIICLTIDADYEINGSKILITGTGCN